MQHALVLAMAIAILPSGAEVPGRTQLPASKRRIRPETKAAAGLLDQGARRSPTFRNLVASLERSDVIVYVTVTPHLPGLVGGCVAFLSGTADYRYVRIWLNAKNGQHALIWMLGHELQHALEVAEVPEVRTEAAFRSLFRRIGIRGAIEGTYDTVAARTAEALVRAELTLATSDRKRASHDR